MGYWIVVVDDEAVSLAEVKSLLDKEDMRVSCLRSGRNLLKFMENHSPDLVLLDIMMPEMDGFETLSALRWYESQAGRNRVPVIFLTGEDDAETERRGLEAGASDFIHKPFDRDILISRIQNTIKNSKTIESLEEEAAVDKLTGFLNKASGSERLAGICASSHGALMVMDLDSFKLVNDLFGHDMGDRVLQAFAGVVRRNTRETDLISRIGGDEFVGFFTDVRDESAVGAMTERLNTQFLAEAAVLMGKDHGIPLGISIGVVTVPEYGRDYELLFEKADSALLTVKQNGKHGYAFYDMQDIEENKGEAGLDEQLERLTRIMKERSDAGGAMMLGSEAFAIVYRFILRLSKRYQVDATELLFSIRLKDGCGKDKNFLRDAVSQFGRTTKKSLRRSDIMMQNSSDQFFVYLPSLTEKYIHIVTDRIMSRFGETEYAREVTVDYAARYVYMKKDNHHTGDEKA